MSGGTGSDSLDGGPGYDGLLGGLPPPGPNRPPPQERSGSIDTVRGGPGDDDVDGTAGAGALYGGDGSDFVSDGKKCRSAKDALDGGDGNDYMFPPNVPAGRT